jgi:RND family efflux transporter MFP subunit
MNMKRKTMAAAAGVLLIAALAVTVLKPKDAASTAAPASALTVELVAPEQRNWPQELRASGAITAWEEIVISPETGGLRIAELLVSVGQRVDKGQLLARLADDTVRAELAKQEALVSQAEASLLQASTNLKRAQSVDVAGTIAPQKLDEYRAAEATARASLASVKADRQSAELKLSQTRIVAPDAGLVASKSGVVGNVAAAGTELYRLIRQGRIEWRAELDARQLSQVRVGHAARVALPSGPTVTGKVMLVSPTLNTTTGRGLAYVSLAADSAAKPGVFASGNIELLQSAALTLPESAVVQRDGRSYVYTVGSDGRAASRVVTTGRHQGGRVEVLSGVAAATQVVAKGGAFISDGAQVAVAAANAASTGSQAGAGK